jgi:hypothetical protein
MRAIMHVGPTGSTPVRDSEGRRVGTVVDADDDAKYVSVHPEAPADALDALGWDANADRVRLPHGLVAETDGAVRLAV